MNNTATTAATYNYLNGELAKKGAASTRRFLKAVAGPKRPTERTKWNAYDFGARVADELNLVFKHNGRFVAFPQTAAHLEECLAAFDAR